MVFTSLAFLFLFLPLFFAAYYVVAPRHRSLVILIGSYVFYGWWRFDFLLLLLAVSAWTYAAGVALVRERDAGRPNSARLALGLAVAGNLAALAFFKYFNFGVNTLDALLTGVGQPPLR